MKTLITLLFSLCLCSLADAQIMIWKQRVTDVSTGGGSTFRQVFTGYVVFQPATTNLIAVNAVTSPGVKKIVLQPINDYNVDYVNAPSGKTLMVFQQAEHTIDNADNGTVLIAFAKGAASLIDTGAGSILLAKSMQFTGQNFYQLNGQNEIDEQKGTFVYDAKDTLDANRSGLTVEQTIAKLEAILQSQGFH